MDKTIEHNDDIKYKRISNEVVKLIVSKHKSGNDKDVIENYTVSNASSKMLGFLCDYWKLQVSLGPDIKVLCFFIKLMSITNEAKAKMVKELDLFEKELYFYKVIKRSIELPDLKPWSAEFVTDLDDAMVFEDMNALQYKLRDKHKRFDMAHTLEALKTLSRFHASSIIYEEKKSEELGRCYSLNEDFHHQLHDSGYCSTDKWFILCSNAALDTLKSFSDYTEEEITKIDKCWFDVWSKGLDLSNPSTEHRSVICHRDLWNNNLMFHYQEVEGTLLPDDCVIVDFQAAKCQPPAGDVMLLLYCNLDPEFREENLQTFLDFYLQELNQILSEHGLGKHFIDKEIFLQSAKEQRLWAIVVCASLIPQFWIDDDLTTEIFCDTAQFDDILTKNKSAFIAKMMRSNSDYKEKVLGMFKEIAERYCL